VKSLNGISCVPASMSSVEIGGCKQQSHVELGEWKINRGETVFVDEYRQLAIRRPNDTIKGSFPLFNELTLVESVRIPSTFHDFMHSRHLTWTRCLPHAHRNSITSAMDPHRLAVTVLPERAHIRFALFAAATAAAALAF